MALWTRLPRAEGAVEMLDGPVPLTDLRECLSDVARLNALFGGRFLTLVHVKRLAAKLPPGRALTVLDVGTGGGDVPRALVRWARRVRRPIRLFALDRDPAVARVALEAWGAPIPRSSSSRGMPSTSRCGAGRSTWSSRP